MPAPLLPTPIVVPGEEPASVRRAAVTEPAAADEEKLSVSITSAEPGRLIVPPACCTKLPAGFPAKVKVIGDDAAAVMAPAAASVALPLTIVD